ncbi:histidine phosphatase family protein [Pseudomonas sp. NPDC007930]|uniref:histidine phosphatase family protein n=1 Tax=Pseudomonas sp. NPDC007930 TaxID=3364417 RepID=UPI0036EDA469
MKATRLLLLCHGPTASQREGRLARAADLPLGTAPPTWRAAGTLLCAPEPRAQASAAGLGQAEQCEALRDVNLGEWAGRRLSTLEQHQPAALGQWLVEPAFTPPGGESLLQLGERLGAWLATLGPGSYTAVTHPAVIRALLISALALPPACFNRLDVAPWAALQLSRHGHWRLRLEG